MDLPHLYNAILLSPFFEQFNVCNIFLVTLFIIKEIKCKNARTAGGGGEVKEGERVGAEDRAKKPEDEGTVETVECFAVETVECIMILRLSLVNE